ncbi:hypothetical protein SNEBB_005978 [Seison nebaliae]|nr:hypothetical protein SNEBB_005978 [Seison nebaliae]
MKRIIQCSSIFLRNYGSRGGVYRPLLSRKIYESLTPSISFVHSNEMKSQDNFSDMEQHEFQAETKKLLDIVSHSLYSDKDVFIRELISNANDAIEKTRFERMKDNKELPSFQIEIEIDKKENVLRIKDNGCGMTKDEMIMNLGTIAHSGSKEFLTKLQETNKPNEIIGQFGVGFYSSFMVSKKLRVFSKSTSTSSVINMWTCQPDTSSNYSMKSLTETELFDLTENQLCRSLAESCGTCIEIDLKDDSKKYLEEKELKEIIIKYSNFINSPILINNDRLNIVEAIWKKSPRSIEFEEHEKFYKFLTKSNDTKPEYVVHFHLDVPLNVQALLYIDNHQPSIFDISQEKNINVQLYSKRTMILKNCNDILPKWLRFLSGIIDCEDIPLNLSRELLQNNHLIRRIRDTLEKKVIKFLINEKRKDLKKFLQFYENYKLFFKEAIVSSTNQNEKEMIGKLLHFETNFGKGNELSSLDDYLKNMDSSQQYIYYLSATNRELAETSPYYEALMESEKSVGLKKPKILLPNETANEKKSGPNVLFVYEPHDELVLMQLQQFGGKQLKSCEEIMNMKQEENINKEMEKDGKEKTNDDDLLVSSSNALTRRQANNLIDWIKKQNVSNKIKDIQLSEHLKSHPCAIHTRDMGAIRHFMKTANLQKNSNDFQLHNMFQFSLTLNTKHPLIKQLHKLKDDGVDVAVLLIEQLVDNAMLSAGLVEDPRQSMSKINDLLLKLLSKK